MAAISGHTMIFVWSKKFICNKTKTEMYLFKEILGTNDGEGKG